MNESLAHALAHKHEEGEGDEEPEVMPAPSLAERGIIEDTKSDMNEKEDYEDARLESAYQNNEGKMDSYDYISNTSESGGVKKNSSEMSLSSSTGTAYPSTNTVRYPANYNQGDDGGLGSKSTRRIEEARSEAARKAMEEEERRVAELTFDADALLPFENMMERAKYIPLRLTYDERKGLRTVNAAINVSDYTNIVDVQFKKKARRNHTILQQIVAFLSGVVASQGYAKGQEILLDRNFEEYEEMIREKLEIARRYKVTNPEKMRSQYGKLVYLIQDAVSTEVQQLLGININKPIRTVYEELESKGGLGLLQDPLLGTATQEILPDKNKSRGTIQLEIQRKNEAVKRITRNHVSRSLSEDDLQQCLYSISDNNSFLNSNRKPILDMIELLKKYFNPNNFDREYSLAIDEGSEGARLSHNHKTQYDYVLQSLTLWAHIIEDTFRLWYLSELDLLSETQPYVLTDTGQGLQRVQQSPRVYKAMHEILHHTKQTSELEWVGSSVIHLGDNNVPNTLVFIDKYTQVSRILSPIVKTIVNLEKMCDENQGLKAFLEAYGGIDKAAKDILQDFFKHAFDGSGGDNFFDAGSCIDGRLTSAWNWCSQLADKPYYPLFKLTGFLSFDGSFR